ncbi:uncharacterized protein Bfra_009892 [Botrytis fragariae]|uniref:Uncharacterized protein n=1 Tax=Botrytis fragariae TaxID=1964551 RepID=A0A8H6AN79_9HELO|nr:uncharacterized protein Bfra_009892 [Botrytis fragariae]KAF5870504.1 hypothetical protein Bfra_009892 [Botrytis fragariae]
MTSLRVLKPNTLYIVFQTRTTRETRDVPIRPLGNENTKVSAYISGSKDPWVGRWGTINPKLSTNRTVRFRDVNLRHHSQSFFLWEIMPTNNNNRVLDRLQQMYISNKHGNWTASKASLRLLQMLHGGHRKINLLFQPIIPAHAPGVFRTIQEVERKLPVQDRGLPSNLTILRVQPGENIQILDFESKPTLKIIGVLSEHPHHHHHKHQHRRRNSRRPRLISRKSSWHRGQHYYDQRRPRERNQSFEDYPLSNKTTNQAIHETRVGEYMEPSIHAQQDHSRRSSVPQLSSAAPPIYPTVGALPPGGYVMPPVNAPQVVAVPQYPQVMPTFTGGQPLPPQTAKPVPVPISSSTSGRRRSISSQPINTYHRKESNSQNSYHPSTDSVNSNPRRRRNSESEASYYGKRNTQEESSSSNHGHHLGVREALSHIKDKLMHPVPPTPSGRLVA